MVGLHSQGSLWSVIAHKLNSYLALNVARMGGIAQSLASRPHDAPTTGSVRLWTLPVVVPAMLSLAGAARVMDRILPDADESLGFLIIARRRLRDPA